jgi:formylglycine-generating enzyme
MNNSYPYNIALSFAEEDHDAALALKLALEAINVSKVYYYPEHTQATWGKPLAEQLSKIYSKEARYAVVFLSKHYFKKPFTNIEFEAIQKRKKQEAPNVYMLPILIGKDTELGHPELEGLTYIQWEHNPKAIAHTISLLLGKTEEAILADKRLVMYHPLFEKGNYAKVFKLIYKAVGGGVSTAMKTVIGLATMATLWGGVQLFMPQDKSKAELPAGDFVMGAHSGRKEDMPPHTVQLGTFSIGKTEVTVAEYRIYCDSTGKPMPPPPDYPYTEQSPIVNITQQEAADYCAWAKGRLPTEAEWEYAAWKNGNGTTDRYSGGNNIAELGYYETNSGAKAHTVAQKYGGKLGLYDMSGNVSEWCADWYAPYANSLQHNPLVTDSSSGRKVRRGGHYNSPVKPDPEGNQLRITYRDSETPNARKPYIGFRVVWDN